MKIRKALFTDVDQIVEINGEVQDIHRTIKPHIFKAARSIEIRNIFDKMLTNEAFCFFVCEINGEIVGYISVQTIIRNEHAFKYSEKYLELDQICIKAELRQKGIGKAFMQKIKEYAIDKGMDRIDLSVWTDNKNAVKAFEAMGFEEFYKRMTFKNI
jgi:ribosomal protein S18 acetylase RimI-like enzyme